MHRLVKGAISRCGVSLIMGHAANTAASGMTGISAPPQVSISAYRAACGRVLKRDAGLGFTAMAFDL